MGIIPNRDEPLMAAGLDSRGGFELRRALAETLSIQLPVTLLYDYQSVAAITEFIVEEAAGSPAPQSAAAVVLPTGSLADVAHQRGAARRQIQGGAAAAGQPQPSSLLKTLRWGPVKQHREIP